MNALFHHKKRSADVFVRRSRRDGGSPHGCTGLIAMLILSTLLVVSPSVFAEELPRKAPLTRYTPLWSNSPFTSRPPMISAGATPEVNPLEDYALLGVSPSSDGFRVTLINRKDPAERIVIDSSRPNGRDDFEILGINREPGRPLSTTVRLSKGSSIGIVSFESSLLTLTPPPAAAPQPQPNAAPAATPPGVQVENDQNVRRRPRPRVVPPPAAAQPPNNNPQGANPATPGNRGGIQGGGRERRMRR